MFSPCVLRGRWWALACSRRSRKATSSPWPTLATPTMMASPGIIQTATDPWTGDLRLGRFGYKAAGFSVEHFVCAALNLELGVTTPIFPRNFNGAEFSRCARSHRRRSQSVDTLPLHSGRQCPTRLDELGRPSRRGTVRHRGLREVPHTHVYDQPVSTRLPNSATRSSILTPTCCCTIWAPVWPTT